MSYDRTGYSNQISRGLIEERSVPEPNCGCWLWLGARIPTGYGHVRIEGRTLAAHRVSYTAFHGPIPPGMFVCHRCDNPPCVNPDHLFLGSHMDNVRDKIKKGRELLNSTRGERNSQAKLTLVAVRKIRSIPFGNAEQITRAALQFGVHRHTIKRIILGTTWARCP